MSLPDAQLKEQTLNWVRAFIIGYAICPFAKQVVDRETLVIDVLHAWDHACALDALLLRLKQMDEASEIETMLLIMPDLFVDFFDYLDFIALAEHRMAQAEYEGVYQLATFHPEYCFADAEVDDPANYTNRSPYPMVHILRETSLDAAIDYYGDTETIPEKNIAKLRDMGLVKIKQIWNNAQILA